MLTNVLAIEPGSLNSAEEKLTPVGVWASIGHTQNTWTSVLQNEVLISKFGAINTFSTSSITTFTVEVQEKQL
jgi:hypothetical protein